MGLGELIHGTLGSSTLASGSVKDSLRAIRAAQGIRQHTQIVSMPAGDLTLDTGTLEAAAETYLSALGMTNPLLLPITSQAASALRDEDNATAGLYDAIMDALDIVTGRASQVQIESILGEVITPGQTPITKAMYDQIALVTNLSALVSGVGIAAEVFSLGQYDQIARELRAYIDQSGASQITGYGYGQILSSALSPLIDQEMRAQMQYELPTIPDLITLRQRSDTFDPDDPAWTDGDLSVLARYGYDADTAGMMLRAAVFFPPVQDWLRFAVREVFDSAAVERGGYDEAFPDDILPHTRKAGIRDETVRQYWRAHWDLPSVTLGYEMLHRGIINRDDLVSLLKTADFAPAWIDRMIDAAYSPLTRVDARRMYEAGVIDRDRYIRSMTDIGYSPEDAELFVAWVDAMTAADEGEGKALSMSQVMQGYKSDAWGREEAVRRLIEVGYDEDEARDLIAIEDAKRADAHTSALSKLARRRYVYRLSDREDLSAELSALGLPSDETERVIAEADIERLNRRKLPSKADLTSWLKDGLISRDTYITRMVQLGYNKEDAMLYVSAIVNAKKE